MRVRRQRWRVLDLRPHTGCAEVALVGTNAANLGIEQRVLTPFDLVEPVAAQPRLKRAAPRVWRRECRRWLAENTPPGSLKAAHLAKIELRAHQLEPALAVVQGRASRLLLADAVGLGKTIQAALIVAELHARGAASRVLVLTPAGLRDQWAAELSGRFALHADVLDGAELRRRAAVLPSSMNPWATSPLAIASIDYVKQRHVLPSVARCRWDVVVVDEAHGVAGDTDRRTAARTLAGRAPYVLLLSATPHNGDRRLFRELCDLGAHGDPPLVFRRSRRDVPLAGRRKVHQLRVATGGHERRMHALLDAFGISVHQQRRTNPRETWLALAVLHKRALSSPFALGRSVERRLRTLADRSAGSDGEARQLALPWIDTEGERSSEDAAPEWPLALSFGSARHERPWLERLAAAARYASGESSKLSALARLLRRVHEPAIVFTEYRDTLSDVGRQLARPAAVLHGGLTRDERNRAVVDFTSGRSDLLLATDAAAEGLNLQQRCRLVINLELPWNPMRLEQRIGRVDRIGQTRTVHAVHLIAAHTGEARLVGYLRSKIAQARQDIGAADPLDGDDELTMARLAIAGLTSRMPAPIEPPSIGQLMPASVSLGAQSHAEAARLWHVRRLLARENGAGWSTAGGPLLARARHHCTRRHLAGQVVLLFRVSLEDDAGRRVETALVPVGIHINPRHCDSMRATETLIGSLGAAADGAVGAATQGWQAAAASAHRTFVAAAIDREQRIRQSASPLSDAPLFQPELFSSRADRERAREAAWSRALDADTSDRLALLETSATLRPRPPELLLVLIP